MLDTDASLSVYAAHAKFGVAYLNPTSPEFVPRKHKYQTYGQQRRAAFKRRRTK